jgi:hypothetical protein
VLNRLERLLTSPNSLINANLIPAGGALSIASDTAGFAINGEIFDGAGASDLELAAVNLLRDVHCTGTVRIRSAVTSVAPAAAIRDASDFTIQRGELRLDNTADAIGDLAAVNLAGGALRILAAGSLRQERFGPLNLLDGSSTLASSTSGGGTARFHSQRLTRLPTSILSLNFSEGTEPNRVVFDELPQLTPAGTLSTQLGILPYVVANTSQVIAEPALVTYDTGSDPTDPSDDFGLRPLIPAEHLSSFDGASAFDHVRIGNSATLSQQTEIQSLTVRTFSGSGGTIFLRLHASLTINSGAMLASRRTAGGLTSIRIEGPERLTFLNDAYIMVRGTPGALFAITAPLTANRIVFDGISLGLGGANQINEIIVLNGDLSGSALGLSNAPVTLKNASLTLSDESYLNTFHFEPLAISTRMIRAGGLNTMIDGLITGGGTLRFQSIPGTSILRHNGDAEFDWLDATATNVLEINGSWRKKTVDSEIVLTMDDGFSPRSILRGDGQIAGKVIGGTISPGRTIGRLTIDEYIAAGTASRLDITLAGNSPGSQYDQLVVRELAQLESPGVLAAQLALDLLFSPSIGSKFNILDNQSPDPIGGTLRNLAEGATFTAGNIGFSITYVGGDGNDVVLTVIPSRCRWR